MVSRPSLPEEHIGLLLAPRSIAVVGATDKPGAYGGQTLLNLQAAGFPGPIYPINPGRAGQLVHGVRCLASLDDVPATPDATVIAVPAAAAVDVLTHMGRIGAKSAVVYASGFAETADGAPRQDALARIARAYGIAVCGPNGNGVVSVPHRAPLWGDSVALGSPGPIGLITQSGNVGVNALAVNRGIGLHSVVSCGNQAVLDAIHYLSHLAENPNGVRSIALYLESDGDGVRLANALAACIDRDIRVVVLKAGRSARGAQTGAAHTGSIAGDARVFQALMSEAGAAWAHDPHELLELAGALAIARRRTGGTAIVTCSGGDASIAADESDRIGLELMTPDDATTARIAALLPPGTAIANPLDYTSHLWADSSAIAAMVMAFADQRGTGPLLGYIDTPPSLDGEAVKSWRETLEGFILGAAQTDAPVLVASTLPELMPHHIAASLAAAGVAPVAGLTTALRAAAALAEPVPSAARLRQIASAAGARATGQGSWLAEHDAKDLLARQGVPIPRGGLASSPEHAVGLADDLGYPVVAKLSHRAVLHKSDVGALRLRLTDADSVRGAYSDLVALGLPGDVLIEQMAPDGVELIVGARRDAVVPCVIVGLGGIWTEVLADVVVLPLPVTNAAVIEALHRLRGAAMLTGGRGRPAVSLDSIASLVVATGTALLSANLHTIELNPVICSPESAVAVDALVRLCA